MASPSKQKGNRFERYIVNRAIEHGLSSKRAYASNGISIGYTEDVDGVIEDITFQAKCRKRIAKWLQPGNADIVVVREDRGTTYAILPLDEYLTLIKQAKSNTDNE